MADVFKITRRNGELSPIWYGKVKTAPKAWERVALFTDKVSSRRQLIELQREADRRETGVQTIEMEHAARPLSEHVADYLAAIKLAGVSEDHHRIGSWMLERLIELAGWKRIADISADSLRAVLTKLASEGKATNYVNKFTSRGKAFVHWLQENRRIALDPLQGVKRSNVAKGKRTRSRRAMVNDELELFLAAAPVDRRRKYLFAMLSGLRRGELADLRWSDLRLNAPIPFIQLREEQTKNQKADAIPLHPALMRVLKELPAVSDEQSRVFGPMPDMKTMARDLLKAGLATESDDPKSGVRIDKGRYINIADTRGRRTDFHSLRHTFKTAVDRTGCTESTSDALTRHGDKTVGDGYRHAELADMLATLRLIPDLSPEGLATLAVTANTGTCDIPAIADQRADHREDQNYTAERLASAFIHADDVSRVTPCPETQVLYSNGLATHRLASALIVDKSFIDKDLRPSTQVD